MKLHERGLAMSKILIVEDEESIADIEKDYLELNGYEVEVCNDGTSGLAAALHEDIDMCILDIMLPGTDGFEICKQVREVKDIPIIMVSAKKEDIDKIRGLGIGADDYITKPFSMDELLARISAHLRREERKGTASNLRFDEELIINYNSRTVFYGETPLEFSNKEASKYCAVKFLQNYWGIKEEETLTIGDQNNDIALLKAGGIRVAMGNATEELKKVATHTTDTVYNDGFVRAMEELLSNY